MLDIGVRITGTPRRVDHRQPDRSCCKPNGIHPITRQSVDCSGPTLDWESPLSSFPKHSPRLLWRNCMARPTPTLHLAPKPPHFTGPCVRSTRFVVVRVPPLIDSGWVGSHDVACSSSQYGESFSRKLQFTKTLPRRFTWVSQHDLSPPPCSFKSTDQQVRLLEPACTTGGHPPHPT